MVRDRCMLNPLQLHAGVHVGIVFNPRLLDDAETSGIHHHGED